MRILRRSEGFFALASAYHLLCLWSLQIALAFSDAGRTSAQSFPVEQATNAGNYTVNDLGGNYRVWQNAVPIFTNDSRQVSYRTNSYTELATGMNFLSNGEWVPSSDVIQITPGGGAATNGQHQVFFAANINASNALQTITPDDLQLNSHIMGLGYYDTSTGSNVLFAELQDSTGQLVASNRVIYPSAFTDCDADVRYTYTLDGIEQDIVVQKQLPSPNSFGLNPETTWLQVWTEFINPPTPVIEASSDGGDEFLDFGVMKMGQGKAFILGNVTNSVPVIKSWRTIAGRTFLVEQLQLDSISAQLQSLPSYSGGGNGTGGTGSEQIHFQGFPKHLPPRSRLANRVDQKLKLAGTHPQEKGLVLDYLSLNTAANQTLKGNTTYYVSGNVNLSGTTIIEGGTVVKFANSSPTLTILGPINCQTAPYSMAVFTSKDDDTVGQQITGSTGTPSGNYANIALLYNYNGSPASLEYMRFSFANTACEIESTQTALLRHIQFVHDSVAMEAINGTVNMQNILAQSIGSEVVLGISTTVNAINMTAHTVIAVFSDAFGASMNVTNSLFYGVVNAGSVYAGFDNFTNTGSSPFTSVGAGANYLTTNTYRGQGTTNIDAGLLADLRNMTTYAPVSPPSFTNDYISTITTSTNLLPTAYRDTNSSTVDVGYHYSPIDYMTTCDYSGCTVTLTNGVVIGYWRNFAVVLDNGSQLVSQGSPNQKNVFAYYTLVQEQPIKLMGADANLNDYPANSTPISADHSNMNQNPSLSLRFTSIYAPQTASNILYASSASNSAIGNLTVRDCEFYGSGAGVYLLNTSAAIGLTNNLFQYVPLTANAGATFAAFNNLYRGDSSDTYCVIDYGGTIINRNNAFDGTIVNIAGTTGWNAFLNTATVTQATSTRDITNNLTWITGPLGNFYQATNSLLLNAGSNTADQLGLYHYTVMTNEVVEGTNPVTIGYHYIALVTNGLPLDSNGNGIPDYLEDVNGSGLIWIILTTPSNGVTFAEPATIPIRASVQDWSGAVTNVQFFYGTTSICGITTPPYSYSWPIVAAGPYSLTGTASDANGITITSAAVNISVTNLCSP